MKPLLVVITGPTAVGKTSISLKIAKHFSCPIISADSRQLFKELKIGTAPPSQKDLEEVQHYFIQSHSIHQMFNASTYEDECIPLIEKLFDNHKVLVMSGGSGLYIDAVLYGKDNLPKANKEIRIKLKSELKKAGIEPLQKRLKELDPEYYNEVDIKNPQRLIRAIEVCELAGVPYSSLRSHQSKKRDFKFILFAINEDRNTLYDRINKRVDLMFEQGLLDEVNSLHPFKHLNAVQTVGYTELFDYLDSKYELNEAVEKIKQHTRNYAKRQLTWLRKYKNINWIKRNESDIIIKLIESHLR